MEKKSEIEKVFCAKCGAEVTPGNAFCPKCGHKVGETTAPYMSYEPEPTNPAKSSKKMPVGIIAGAVFAIIAIIAIITVIPAGGGQAKPDLEAIYSEHELYTATFSELGADGSYISIDTNPNDSDDYMNLDALSAIRLINDDLGLPDSVLNRMEKTRSMDGIQTYSNDVIEVSWTYHPDQGLEVTYSLKDWTIWASAASVEWYEPEYHSTLNNKGLRGQERLRRPVIDYIAPTDVKVGEYFLEDTKTHYHLPECYPSLAPKQIYLNYAGLTGWLYGHFDLKNT